LDLVYGAAGKPVTRNEAKLHCRVDVDITEDDTLIDNLIETATRFVEQEIWGTRQIMTATYDVPVECFWEGALRLPRPPLQAVTVYYYDTAGTEQTLSSSLYTVRKPWRMPGTIERATNQSFPSFQSDRSYPIRIQMTCGYLAPVTAATTDVITSTGRAFQNGDRVRFYTTGDDLPAGLSEGTDYYVISASSQTFSVATTVGGSAVDITDTGTGRHMCGWVPWTVKQAVLLVVGHWYRNREAVGTVSTEIELAVKSLLETEGWGSYS
jgi:hypothetical protein